MVANVELSPKKPDCQRFYGFGKKIPKDVKRHCGMCRQHGIVVETRGHLCQFKNCDCWKCKLVRQRRSIMSTQIRLRREQDKRFQRTTDASEADIVPWADGKKKTEDINMCYFCQKCKNHGVLMWKKDHKKNCEFANCRCEQCDLIDTRRALDRHIKNKKDEPSTSTSSELSSSSSPGDENTTPSTLSLPSSEIQTLLSSNVDLSSTLIPSPLLKPLEFPSFPLTPQFMSFTGMIPPFAPYTSFYPLPSPISPLHPIEMQMILNALCNTHFGFSN